MKILIINLRIGTGSVGRIVSDLYHGILENGDECKVAYARGGIGDIPSADTIKICKESEIKKHALLTRLLGNTAFYSKRSTRVFLSKVDVYKPDVIHIHGLYGYYINMKLLFNYVKKNNIRLISTLHSCWDFTGHCCYFDYVKCDNWKSGCLKCRQKNTYPKSSFLDNTAWNYKRKKELYNKIDNCVIVTPSRWLSNLVSESFLNIHPSIVIPNGIDLEKFHYTLDEFVLRKYDIDSNKIIILCIASIWERRKGLNDIIELSSIIDDSIQLIVVGVTDKQRKAFPKKTILINRTNNIEELVALYSIANVMFNPTYEDNYPTVNLESIACGTPVVTYDTGGSGELLTDKKYGIVIKARQYDTLIAYSKEITDKIDLKDILNFLSYNNMCKKYIYLYHKCR